MVADAPLAAPKLIPSTTAATVADASMTVLMESSLAWCGRAFIPMRYRATQPRLLVNERATHWFPS
jgi:hypothetical protein